jgi:phosphoglycolate phosphatase
MREEYRVRNSRKTRPYPGVEEMLDALAGRGVPAAILSNKPHDSTLEVVGRFFPGRAFKVVLGARDGVPVKPDPGGAIEIAAQLGFSPADILYLGDTNTDMQTATTAGMFAVGALWGFRTAGELLAHGAKALVEHPREVLAFFDD